MTEMANKRQKLNMYTPSPPELMSLQDGDGGLEDTIQTILKELNDRSGTQEQINLLTNEINPTMEFYKQKFHMGVLKRKMLVILFHYAKIIARCANQK